MNEIVFTVAGVPQPQGSARAFTYQRTAEKGGGIGARVDSDNPKLKAWRLDVGKAARVAYRGPLLDGPVRIVAAFYLPAPKSLRRPKPHTTRPDVDKLSRAIADAITGIIYRDDAQVTQLKATKSYTGVGEGPHAIIAVTPLLEEGRLL